MNNCVIFPCDNLSVTGGNFCKNHTCPIIECTKYHGTKMECPVHFEKKHSSGHEKKTCYPDDTVHPCICSENESYVCCWKCSCKKRDCNLRAIANKLCGKHLCSFCETHEVKYEKADTCDKCGTYCWYGQLTDISSGITRKIVTYTDEKKYGFCQVISGI